MRKCKGILEAQQMEHDSQFDRSHWRTLCRLVFEHFAAVPVSWRETEGMLSEMAPASPSDGLCVCVKRSRR